MHQLTRRVYFVSTNGKDYNPSAPCGARMQRYNALEMLGVFLEAGFHLRDRRIQVILEESLMIYLIDSSEELQDTRIKYSSYWHVLAELKVDDAKGFDTLTKYGNNTDAQ
jgi:hypothetical protein